MDECTADMKKKLVFTNSIHENSGDSGEDSDDNDKMVTMISKTSLVAPTEEELAALKLSLQKRLQDNKGECIYEVGTGEGDAPGITEAQLDSSVQNLEHIAEANEASCVLLRQRITVDGVVAQYLIRKVVDELDFLEVRIAVVGNVDAGKSTLLGVLTHGDLDNGRGLARKKLFRHKHEMESGRTSSVGNDILGFDSSGNVINKPEHGHLDWTKICEESSKVITFIDLAGHEKYLKTTVFGMTGHAPDFTMLMVGANAGVVGMTREHLALALALYVPVFIVVTKVDMCPANILQKTLALLQKILKSQGIRKIPVLVQSMDDVVVSATNFTSERMCPIFQVSNVTGANLDLLKKFLNLLHTQLEYSDSQLAEFQIDDTFSVPGVGTVVSGTTMQGTIRVGETLLLGPDALGIFQPATIKSIHRKRLPVKLCRAGQTASFSLKKIKRSHIRKGMVMVSPKVEPKACWEFESEILVLRHPTTISVKYQAMVHVGSVRQTASIIEMSADHLRTGNKALCRFRFIKNPEYLHVGMRMLFREGLTKAVGTIIKLHPHVSAIAQNTRQQRMQAKKAAEHNHQHGTGAPQNQSKKPSKRNRRGGGGGNKSNDASGPSNTTTTIANGHTSLTASVGYNNPADTSTGDAPSTSSSAIASAKDAGGGGSTIATT